MIDVSRFALALLAGISLMWCLMPRHDVSSGFFRIQMLVALGLGVLVAVLSSGTLGTGGQAASGTAATASTVRFLAAIGIAVSAFAGSVLWTLDQRRGGTWCVFLIAAGAAGVLLWTSPAGRQLPAGVGWVGLISELSTAALLGSAVTGMLLGHWYLTAPAMSIAPLGRLTQFFGAAAAIRLIISSVGWWLARGELAGGTQGLWLAMRWTSGILIPLVLFVMVRRILRYRNTQAATGVLFVGVILTFIGEMSAALLYRETQWPL